MIERITKIDAAIRQLNLAIRLFFSRSDCIGVHTLAAASHGILSDIATKKRITTIIKNNSAVRPERKTEFLHVIHEAQNFFKHANKDPDASISFKPIWSQFFMIDSVFILNRLESPLSVECRVYYAWFLFHHADLFETQGEIVQLYIKLGKQLRFNTNDFEGITMFLQSAKSKDRTK